MIIQQCADSKALHGSKWASMRSPKRSPGDSDLCPIGGGDPNQKVNFIILTQLDNRNKA